MDSLIVISLIIVFVVIHTWWNARKQAQENRPGTQVPPPRPGSGSSHPQAPRPGSASPPRPTVAAGWEEELRRLLEGDAPAPPPLLRPTPPPLASPPPLPRPRPAPPPSRPRTPPPVPVPVLDHDMETGLPVKMPSLTESAQAYVRASQLETRVAEHMRRVDRQVEKHQQPEQKKAVAAEVAQALGLLRTRPSQRAAILAAAVLGSPRAYEDWEGC